MDRWIDVMVQDALFLRVWYAVIRWSRFVGVLDQNCLCPLCTSRRHTGLRFRRVYGMPRIAFSTTRAKQCCCCAAIRGRVFFFSAVGDSCVIGMESTYWEATGIFFFLRRPQHTTWPGRAQRVEYLAVPVTPSFKWTVIFSFRFYRGFKYWKFLCFKKI